MDRQCPSCGGFCKKSGCERENVKREHGPLVWMNKYGHVASFQNEEYKDPLYTAPPKKEWVGLTDEDLEPMCDDWRIVFGGYVHDFAKAIEAKLKDKNSG